MAIISLSLSPSKYHAVCFTLPRNVMEAMEWLLERGSMEEVEGDCIFGGTRDSTGDTTSSLPTTTVTTTTTTATATSATSPIHLNPDVPQDPAQKVLKTFLQYRKKWFQVCYHLSLKFM